ncbi:MAG: stage III sporulation protein AF [Sporolactobacillus sp.]
MQYLENWVSQLVVLILFAVILELLLPSGGFQKYVRLVIGLVLIVALLGPVMALFHVNPQAIINGMVSDKGTNSLKRETTQEKKEIEQQQAAYIQEQMAVQMKNTVKEALAKRYRLQIERIKLTTKEDNLQELNLQQVTLVLRAADQSGAKSVTAIQPIEPVSIHVGKQSGSDADTDHSDARTDQIRSFLAGKWQINKKMIAIQVEGGD